MIDWHIPLYNSYSFHYSYYDLDISGKEEVSDFFISAILRVLIFEAVPILEMDY